MKHVPWIVTLSLMIAAEPAWAARTQVHEAAESQNYGRKFGGMIGRGALNAVTCFVDPVINIVNETKAGPPLVGTLVGVGKGLGCGVLRLGSGIVDLVTFWVPGFNGVPVASSYENCLAVESPGAMQSPMMSPAGAPASTTSGWEVPTTEPGAAQAPASSPTANEPAPAHRKWTK